MSGFDIGDWVIVRIPPAIGPQDVGEIWEGEVERVADSPLGGQVLTVRQSDSTVAEFHERFCTHVRRPMSL